MMINMGIELLINKDLIKKKRMALHALQIEFIDQNNKLIKVRAESMIHF